MCNSSVIKYKSIYCGKTCTFLNDDFEIAPAILKSE